MFAFFTNFRLFPKLVWIILVGVFITSSSFFMSIPFLALHLTKNLHISPIVAGMTIGASPLIGTISSFFMGYLGDWLGRTRIIPLACVGFTLAFFGFSMATLPVHFLIFNMIYGVSRSTLRMNLTALLTDLSTPQTKKLILQTQYYMINLGACIGPLAGAYLFAKGHRIAFIMTAIIYLIFGAILLRHFIQHRIADMQVKASTLHFSKTMRTLFSDRRLLLFILTFVISSFNFVQFETNIPQHLYDIFSPNGVKYFSYLMATNAITIVIFQFILMHWSAKFSTSTTMTIGLIPQALGFFAFFALPPTLPNYMLAMFIFSIGEILTISNIYVIVDEISPKELKSSYFGSLELSNIGFMVGPVVGGWVFTTFGGNFVFLTCALLLLFSILTFRLGLAQKPPSPHPL
ncbi:MAG: MFS transporter [Bdellovibrionales bacterium]|nr:MFS transporter [Bdellovibrionales bacterium]